LVDRPANLRTSFWPTLGPAGAGHRWRARSAMARR
jgi:hypothetical protein